MEFLEKMSFLCIRKLNLHTMNLPKRILILLLLVTSTGLLAQVNPLSVKKQGVTNQVCVLELESNTTPVVKNKSNSFNTGTFSYQGSGIYEFEYEPHTDFNGLVSFDIEYTGVSQTPGQWPKKYMSVVFDIQTSIIEAVLDVVDVPSGTSNLNVNVLQNDVSSVSGLEVVDIAHVKNGTSTIVSSESLNVGIDNLDEPSVVHYVIKDSSGNTETGLLVLRPENYEVESSLTYITTSLYPVRIILPNKSYNISPLNLGDAVLSDGVLEYTPNQYSEGIETFQLSSGQDIVEVSIEILSPEMDGGFLRDDYVYTSLDKTTVFDVDENDVADIVPIVFHSPEIENLLFGRFAFDVPNYPGLHKFFYVSYNGFEHETANIYLRADNYLPKNTDTYEFDIAKNATLLLDYDVPISGYDFTLSSAPSNGQVIIHEYQSDLDLGCGSVSGKYLISYTPNLDFYSQDEFELEYFIDGQSTGEIVKLVVNIDEEEDIEDCPCLGKDCVWSGDTNNDGKVTLSDLLPLGLFMGHSGTERSVQNDDWSGELAQSWNYEFGESKVNIKHLDANGDGVITSEDSEAIKNNFGSINNLVSDDFLELANLNIQLVPHTTEVDSGDWLLVDVVLGDPNNVVRDLQGLNFNLPINPAFVDSSSVFVDYLDDSWFANASPVLDVMLQPTDGNIFTGGTRTLSLPTSGEGPIITLGFIVEDELEGFKLENGEESLSIPLTITDGAILNNRGFYERLPKASTSVSLRLDRMDTPVNADDIIVYPNPTSSIANIFVNGGQRISEIVIRDIAGKLTASFKGIDANRYSVDVSQLNTGMYFMTIGTENGEEITKKLQVIDR